MPRDETILSAYYSARAPEYDRVYEKPERQSDLRAIERWLPGHFAGARVLEIACGTGYWTQLIAPIASHIVAIDAAPETLRIAEGRVPEEKVSFLGGDAYALPSHLGPFDAAFAGFWLSHVPKRRRREFLRGLQASLEPGAKVVLLDNRYVEGSNWPIAARDADGDTFQTRRLADGSTHEVLKNFPCEGELRELVAEFDEHPSYTAWTYYWALVYATPKS